MASLTGYGEHDKSTPWLKATVAVSSQFRWGLDVLQERITAALGLTGALGPLEIRDICTGRLCSPWYLVTWPCGGWDGVAYRHTGIPDWNEDEFQRQTDTIVAVLNEMEQKYNECLGWLMDETEHGSE